MNKSIKNLIVLSSFLVLAFAAVPAFASAYVAFNTDPLDCITVSAANYTTYEGVGNPCWPSSTVHAAPGDVINIKVYYHNTGNASANNTTVKVSNPGPGQATSFNFTGSVSATGATTASGNAQVILSQSATLTQGQAQWFPNQTSVGQPVSISQVLSSNGLNIGSVAPGWASQGTVIVSFNVVAAQQSNCTINSFAANPSTINQNGTTTLSWSTSNCATASISQIGSQPVNGSATTGPLSNTTTFTLTATGANGSIDTQSVTVTVNKPECAINSFTANPMNVNSGSTTTLTWNTTHCTNASISTIGTVPVNGSTSSNNIYQTTTFTLTATGTTGIVHTKTVTVTVNQQNCTINTFFATPSQVAQNGSSTLQWSTSHCANASISQIGSVPVNGSVSTGALSATKSFTLTATGSNGSIDTQTITVTVTQAANCVVNTFYASPSQITSGNTSTLTWSTSHCTNVSISTIGTVGTSGSVSTGNISQTTTYTITATGANGSMDTKTATVTVTQSPSCVINTFYASPNQINPGNPTTLTWSTSNCVNASISTIGTVPVSGSTSSNNIYQTTTFILTATGASGNQVTSQTTVTVIQQPQLCTINSFISSTTQITSGGTVVLTWSTSNASSVSISTLGTMTSTNGSITTGFINQTTTFTLTAYCQSGSSVTSQVVVYVNQAPINYPPTVTTNSASNVSAASATLNGYVDPRGSSTTRWFEWGLNPNALFSSTTHINQGTGAGSFSDYISGLQSNTTYYFRAAAQNAYGTDFGSTLSFTTTTIYVPPTPPTPVPPVIINNNTTTFVGGGTGNPYVMLKITPDFETVSAGDTITFTVEYRNISGKSLKNSILRVIMPVELQFKRSTKGIFSSSDNALTLELGTLLPNDHDTFIVQVDVLNKAMKQNIIVTTAHMVFTNPNGIQDNALAYAINKPTGTNGTNFLAGLALFGDNGILPTSLLGWLILILIILGLVMLARRIANRPSLMGVPMPPRNIPR